MENYCKPLLAVAALFVIVGCTSLRAVDLPPDNLPREIRAGTVVAPGDTARVTTKNGRSRDMHVTVVDDDTIQGDTADGGYATVPIDDITTVEKRQFSAVKTAGLVYFGAPVFYILLALPLMVLMALSA